MNRKVIFLDIDGTIVNYKGKIPQSAEAAIKQARDLGHLLVICTGRSKFQVYKELLDIGFDGIIAASGGYVQCGDKDIYHRYLPEENVKVIYDYFVKTLEENPEYVENIEKKIIQENKPVFDALAEQIKSSIGSRKKMDKISQSRNLQMGEKSLHERNYDRFQQIARDRISGNRHKPTLSEIAEKVEGENKGRTK